VKILVAGDWHSVLHEETVADAFVTLGHTVERFPWHTYFDGTLISRLQNKYLWGPRVSRLNADLLGTVRRIRPDVIFVYRGTHVFPETVAKFRSAAPDAFICGYNNDDPFGPGQPRWLWRHFVQSLRFYDAALAFRHCNIEEFVAHGAPRAYLLRYWFVPERSHPVELSPEDHARFDCDAVFVGHYEDDGRLEVLEAVVKAGFKLRLYGPDWGWHGALAKSATLAPLMPLQTVWGNDYNKALCGAKAGLCFFSRLNRDTYTARCFEIPATGTLLLSEYTEDAASLYTPGIEADFFRNPAELVAKLRLYVDDDTRREKVAAAGLKRAWSDGHDVVSRMRDLLEWITEVRGGKPSV
jgi:hypothetical protein